MKKPRKRYAPEEKVAILRRHLPEKEPISGLCGELGFRPTVFYRPRKEFFENGASAFEQKALPNHSAEQERIAYLEKKIQTKVDVLIQMSLDGQTTTTSNEVVIMDRTGKMMATMPGGTGSAVRLSPEIPDDFYDSQKVQ